MGRVKASVEEVNLIGIDGGAVIGSPIINTATPYTLLGGLSMSYADTNYGSYWGVFWGRGTTPPTRSDYRLEDPIIDGTITTVGSVSNLVKTDNGDCYRISSVHQVTNNTNETITISEAGTFGNFTSGGKVFLLDHTVLPTPVTIPPRKTASIEYIVNFPYEL